MKQFYDFLIIIHKNLEWLIVRYPDTQLLNPHSMHTLHPSVITSFDLQDGHSSLSSISITVF